MDDSVAPFSELASQDSASVDRRTSAANAELEYLLQLRHHLNAAFELFDERCMPILPPASGTVVKRLRRLALQPDGSPMRAALEQVLASGQPRVDVFDGLRIAIARIVSANPLRAALIALAEPADDPKRMPGGRGLELMTGWLAEMVAKPVGAADSGRDTEWRQISAFCRVVSEQAVLGSETAVIHVFIEALAIWDDLDVRAYAAELDRTFSECVTLNGADPALAPRAIDPSALRDTSSENPLSPLSILDMDRLGFTARGRVSIARVPDGAHAGWLLVFIGEVTPEAGSRIAALINVLGEVLNAARAAEMSRLTWALLQSLVTGSDSTEEKIGRALQHLTAATGRSAGMSITRLDGAVLMCAGEAAALESWAAGRGVSVRHPILESCELLLALAPSETSHALVRDQRLLDAAAAVLGDWTAALLKRDESLPGRRGGERPFGEILQQQIKMARESGTELAVIVVKPGSAPPAIVRKWVREMRGQLRAVDIAVALPTGEVGIVLPSTSLGEATRVVARLRQLCGADQNLSVFASANAGVVSLAEQDLDDATTLMGEARTRAGLLM
jgi:hypothetical protein